ncbi:hypothetical protein BGX38DRAFT_1153419 [Terfezia claveryi]|nr:hypothetical protein BGX38DRAFT_1153419 [Terfezia claveryi]
MSFPFSVITMFIGLDMVASARLGSQTRESLVVLRVDSAVSITVTTILAETTVTGTTPWTTSSLTSVTSATTTTSTTSTTITTTSTPWSLLESLVNLNDLFLLTLFFPLGLGLLSSNEDALLFILLEGSSVLPLGVISRSFVGLTSGWEGSKGGSLSGLLGKVVIIGLDLLLLLLRNLRSRCSLNPRFSTPSLSTPSLSRAATGAFSSRASV